MSTQNGAQMALECLKIVLKIQNFAGLCPWDPLMGAYSIPPQTPQLLLTPFTPSGCSGCLSHFAPSFEQMPFKFSDIFFFLLDSSLFIANKIKTKTFNIGKAKF